MGVDAQPVRAGLEEALKAGSPQDKPAPRAAGVEEQIGLADWLDSAIRIVLPDGSAVRMLSPNKPVRISTGGWPALDPEKGLRLFLGGGGWVQLKRNLTSPDGFTIERPEVPPKGPVVFVEEGKPVFVGREDPGAQGQFLHVPGSGVSRRHLKIWKSGLDLLVQDLGSSNGSFIFEEDALLLADAQQAADQGRAPQSIEPLRLGSVFAGIAQDPTYEATERSSLYSLRAKLRELNKLAQLFSDKDTEALAKHLHPLFSKGRVDLVEAPFSTLQGGYLLQQDLGSGLTIMSLEWEGATGGLILQKGDTPKKQLLHQLFLWWASHFRMEARPDLSTPLGEGRLSQAVEHFQETITSKYPSVRLVNAKNASPSKVDAVVHFLSLLPGSILGSETMGHRLRGGIDLAAPRDQAARIGHYDEESGLLGIQPTVHSVRGFVEVFAHEFGHVIEADHLGAAVRLPAMLNLMLTEKISTPFLPRTWRLRFVRAISPSL